MVERLARTGQEMPSGWLSMVAGRVFGQRGWRVVLRIYSERNQLHLGHSARGLLHLAHQGTHPRTGACTGREDEVGHPDLSVQRFLVEGPSGFIGQLEARDLSKEGQGRLLSEASAEDHSHRDEY